MDNNSQDRAAVRIPPPIFFFGCLGVGFLLEYLFPIHLFRPSPSFRIICGCAFIIISGCLAAGAFIVLIRNKTPFDPRRSTIKIVKEGSFRFSRNPLYLGLLLLLSGFAFLFFSLWLFMAIPILFILLLNFAVKPEEHYLSVKFGEEYLDYKEKVRRWI